MGEARARIVILAALAVVGCLGRDSQICGDGRVCAAGTICVVALDLCADPAHVAACTPPAIDGDDCVADDIAAGTCQGGVCFPAGCGNGVVDQGEACDDGNTVSGDGCSADCLSNERCDNAIVDRNEQCDCGIDGNMNPDCAGPNSATGGLCRLDCNLHCGDGVVAAGEACDYNAPEQPSCIDLEGEQFDRGLTACSSSCTPFVDIPTCHYVGWRRRDPLSSLPNLVALAPTAAGDGFFLAGGAGRYLHYEPETIFLGELPLAAIWASSAEWAIAVGAAGVIARYEDETWTSGQAAAVDLHDVWGTGPADVYAVGDGGIVVHWDGAVWAEMATPAALPLRGVAGHGDTVYAVGDGGTMLELDGGVWQAVATGTTVDLKAIAATAEMVAAVGDGGLILENRGAGWAPARAATTADLTGVWGGETDGFFAVGDGVILFFDGAVWRWLSVDGGPGAAPEPFIAIEGLDGEELVVLGEDAALTYEGSAWAPALVPTLSDVAALWASGPDDVFAVGTDGVILHHDGLTWALHDSNSAADLLDVWGTALNEVFAVGSGGTILRYDGVAWAPLASPTTGVLTSVWTDGAALLVAGSEGAFEYSGAPGAWSHFAGAGALHALRGFGPDTVWAAGPSGTWYYDGSGWANGMDEQSLILDFTGPSPSQVHAVGKGSWFHDGVGWSHGPFGTAEPFDERALAYTGVAESPTVGVVAVGQDGKIERWDGVVTEQIRGRVQTDLGDVAIAGRVVFMAGKEGTIQTLVFHR